MEHDETNSGTVISVADFGRGLASRVCNDMRSYWDGLRKGRAVPMRSDVDPRGIGGNLEYAFIVERVAPGMVRMRIAGLHLNDLMGMEVRGMPMSALFAPSSRKPLAEALEACFAGPNAIEMDLVAETSIGKPTLTAKLVLLPLTSDLGDMNRALGCLVSEGEIGRKPRRFDIASHMMTPVDAGKPMEQSLPTPIMPQFAEGSPSPAERGLAKARLQKAQTSLPQVTASQPPASPAPEISERIARMTPEERRAMMRIV